MGILENFPSIRLGGFGEKFGGNISRARQHFLDLNTIINEFSYDKRNEIKNPSRKVKVKNVFDSKVSWSKIKVWSTFVSAWSLKRSTWSKSWVQTHDKSHFHTWKNYLYIISSTSFILCPCVSVFQLSDFQ